MSDWVRIADESDVSDGEAFASEVEGEAIALYRYEGAIYAIGDVCTHEHVRLSDGWLDGDRIECPLHQSCFEIRTGKVIEGGPAYEDVPAYAVKVEGGGVFVRRNA
ncbi:MAG TPA: non-heme iron oxygenase ferredoxin subunit [Allosphingosinicella sp.]|jgi:nitrite reductase/ring-hydroxylating ferredoxin subunit|nr:non-heme iron oxygenase ferredoxin subunit [Allosphingosinicella sp.]